MTGDAYRAAITKLGLSINAAGRFFDVAHSTAHRWPIEGPPPTVEIFIRLMLVMQRALFIRDVPGWINSMIGRDAGKED